VRHLIAHNGWQQLQALLLQLLAAFENEKLVSDVAAGSAMTRQAQAVAALQQQLTGFLATCIAALLEQQQQQVGGKQVDLVASLLTAYMDRVVEVSERAPTAAVLLQAVADAMSQVASAAAAAGICNSTGDSHNGSSSSSNKTGSNTRSSPPLCELGPQELLAHFSAVLAHVSYLHPGYMRPNIQQAVLRLVPLCSSTGSCGAEVALGLLAASKKNMQQIPAAAGGDGNAECFMAWLDAALSAQVESAAAAAAGGKVSQLQLWLQPLQDQASCAAAPPQLKLLHCLGLVSASLCDSNQQAVAAVLQNGAVALGSAAEDFKGSVGPAAAAAAAAWTTALACLACGVAASMQTTATAAAAGSDASTHSAPSATALAASLQQLLPALLHHHRTVYAAAGVYSPTWVSWLTQLLQHVRHTSPPPSAAAAALDPRHWQQLQTAVLGELTHWQQRLAADVAAAAAAAELDQQLLLLSTSHMACYSLQCSTDQQSSDVTQLAVMSTAELDSCLKSLCQLEPGSSFSELWRAAAASSSSSSVSRSEMTDALLEHYAALFRRLRKYASVPLMQQHVTCVMAA
jgi:hypothetical protein